MIQAAENFVELIIGLCLGVFRFRLLWYELHPCFQV